MTVLRFVFTYAVVLYMLMTFGVYAAIFGAILATAWVMKKIK